MHIYLLRRIIQLIPVLLGVTLVVFLIMQLIPGDPAVLLAGEGATAETVAAIRHELGLDRPILVQYLSYVSEVARGDLGESIRSNRPVLEEIKVRLPVTIQLATASIVISILLGLVAGIISATRQYSAWDTVLMLVALLGVSLPSFWIGLLLIFTFSVKMHLLPVAGWGTFQHMILPALTLGASGAAIVARMTRSSMLDVIRQDYIRTARAKGLKENIVIWKHALKNALIPVITVVGLQFGAMLGGTVIVESIFAINGLGRLIVDAIRTRDLPMVQGGVLIACFIFVMVNLMVDILYRAFNKRIELD
ncbi:peptide ABC transporter permease [Paenibacillus swuensis]|uniref:Nickel import system permease protein NikB n=1 Tax=Paenibacillus swuensis TaxID=1178515 RepID=A0A172TE55_9BACL|nr:nickel ABC transporter permease [Paenibacillus swuensis]ANE45194.1 peptide ABC transporter permease [Paenibacillus swuensis]